MSIVDITGIDRDLLLQKLWEKSEPAAFFKMSGLNSPQFDLVTCKREIHDNYADYVCGRVIKADIYSSNTVDPAMYDRDNGQGAFASVVAEIRQSV